MENLLKIKNSLLKLLLVFLVLLISLIIDFWLLVPTLISIIIVILFTSNKFQYLFLFFRIISLLLYSSYYLETGSYFTPGGDDFGILDRHIVNVEWYDINDFLIGGIANYPLFYLINKFLYEVFFSTVGIDHLALYLTILNNLILAHTFLFLGKISKSIHKKDFSNYVLIFTPFIYFSSVFLRDVYVYYFFIIAFYYFIEKKNKHYILILFFLSFLIRPETSLFVLALFFLSLNKIYSKIIVIGLLISPVIYFWNDIKILFRTADQLDLIYNSSVTGLSSEDGIGQKLKDSTNPFVNIIWVTYNYFKPLPPSIFKELSFENFFNSIGNLYWYLVGFFSIAIIILKKRNNYFTLIFSFLIIAVMLVSFVGGTQRHYLMFIPLIILNYKLFDKSLLTRKLLLILIVTLFFLLYMVYSL